MPTDRRAPRLDGKDAARIAEAFKKPEFIGKSKENSRGELTNPQSVLAVILGASVFPRSPKLAAGDAFYNSAADFMDYLTAPSGLALPRTNVRWLFDDSRNPSDLLDDVTSFLQLRSDELERAGSPVQDLIVYYVGHGLFTRGDQAYSLAVRATNQVSEGSSSIRASDLA